MDTWAFLAVTLLIGAVIGSFAVAVVWLIANDRRGEDD